jgi:glycolate dehydrogenase FAD-linked subunit
MNRPALISDLIAATAADRVITDPAELFVYESDGFTIAHARPAAVVFVTTTQEVQKVIGILIKHEAQIVPRGTGTGLAGGCVAFDNGVVVSTVKMNKIFTIDLENRVAHVQAGVRNTALSDAVSQLPLDVDSSLSAQDPPATSSPSFDAVDSMAGQAISNPKKATPTTNPYHFAPDPSSQRASSIGGNASTNAGGIHTLKDFVTSNHILGIEMVLANGEVIHVGGQNGAYESGPFDLPGLICGHEGTFGIITSLWVRLVPKASSFRTIVAFYSTTADACNTVSEIIAAGHLPAAMEMLDGAMIQIVEDAFHFGFSRKAQAMILIELDGIESLLDAQMKEVCAICDSHSPISGQTSSDPARRAALWKARKSAFGAIGRISHSYCTQDACVPRSKLAEVLQRIDEIGKEHGLSITNVFHAGDGNVHPIFLYDDRDEDQVQNTLIAAEKVLKYCIDIGGTVTGEHGVGVEKLHIMPYQFDHPTMEQFLHVKQSFDPDERINAGKLMPSDKIKISLLKPGRHVPQ